MADSPPFTEDADQIDEQDVVTAPARAIAPPPPPAVAAPAMVVTPGGRTVAPPVGYPGNATAIGLDTQFRSMVNRGTPIDQASAAVESAMKFQAQRGYQNDLQAGVAPAEALAKWAPMLFGGKGSSPGSTASLIRAMTPPADKVMDIGGVGYRIGRTGQAVPITPPKAPSAPTMSQFDKTKLADLASNSRAIRRKLAAGSGTKSEIEQDRADLEANLNEERTILNRYRLQSQSLRKTLAPPGPASVPAVAAPSAAAPSTARVRVRRKDGKIGSIPASQLDAALAAGYSRVQ